MTTCTQLQMLWAFTPIVLLRTIVVLLFSESETSVAYPSRFDDNPYMVSVVEQLSSPTFGTVNVTTISVPSIKEASEYLTFRGILFIHSLFMLMILFVYGCCPCVACPPFIWNKMRNKQYSMCTLVSWFAVGIACWSFTTTFFVAFANPVPSTESTIEPRIQLTPEITSIVVESSHIQPQRIVSTVQDAVVPSLQADLKKHGNYILYAFAMRGCVPVEYIPSICRIMKGYDGTTCRRISVRADCLLLTNETTGEHSLVYLSRVNTPIQSIQSIYPDLAYRPSWIEWVYYKHPQRMYILYWMTIGIDASVFLCAVWSTVYVYCCTKAEDHECVGDVGDVDK